MRDKVTAMQQAVFDRGTSVGVLAQQLFPGGINSSPDLPRDYDQAIEYTSALISANVPVIYEAGFAYEGVRCFVDILVREKEGWHAYEVKSSTSVSNIYHLDAALQYYVMKSSGLPLTGMDIVILNNRYTRQGKIDIQSLFSRHPLKTQVERLQPLIRQKIGEFMEALAGEKPPAVDIGPHCTDPYACDFMGHCWRHVPPGSVFEVSGLVGPKKWDLYRRGILKLVDIPPDFPLTPAQKLQISSTRSGKGRLSDGEVVEFLRSLRFPLWFLDFESFQPAVPLFDMTRPYQQVPFQYSLHYLETRNSKPAHVEFLAETGPDPRPPFAESLIRDLEGPGDILVYNIAFERRILQELAHDFPPYDRPLRAIISRMRDLMDPFRKKQIYLPEMNGSYSIKHVLPAMVPGFGYEELEIAEGGSASIAFQGLFTEKDPEKIARTRQQLLEYCKTDTLAMVKILEKMRFLTSDL